MPSLRRQPVTVRLPDTGVFVLESYHAPGFRMAEERHDFLELFYVFRGAGVFQVTGRDYVCQADEVVIVPPGQLHRIIDDPTAPLALYGICVAPWVWRPEPALLVSLPAGRLPLGPALAARARADLRRLLFEQTLARPGGHCLIAGLTLQLLALIAQASDAPAADRHPDERRDAVRRYAEELPGRFFEAAHLDQAAAELGMSRRRFTQLFREVTGSTWADLLAQLRIDYACQLLRATRRSVLSVAFECGYEDLSGFYRAFKRQTGLAPHAWRQWQAADSCPIRQNGLPDPPRQR